MERILEYSIGETDILVVKENSLVVFEKNDLSKTVICLWTKFVV